MTRAAFAVVVVWSTRAAAASGPGPDEADLAKAVELRVGRHYASATALLAAVEQRNAANPDVRAEAAYQRGLVLEDAGRPDEAAAAYQLVVTELPGAAAAGHAELSLARVQLKRGKQDDAVEHFHAVTRRFPRLASEALLGEGAVEEARGRAAAAATAYRTVLRSFPQSSEAADAKRELAALCGRLLSATAPTEPAAVLARGECLLDQEHPDDARALYEGALKRKLDSDARVQLLMALGAVYDVLDRAGAAEKTYRQVVRAAPGTPVAAAAQFMIVQGFLDRGRLTEAIRELQRIVKGYPNTPDAARAEFMTGSCYEGLRDPRKAEEAYRKVLELGPQTPWAGEAQRSLVRLLEQVR